LFEVTVAVIVAVVVPSAAMRLVELTTETEYGVTTPPPPEQELNWQVCPLPHVTPHPPQFFGSLVVSTHEAPHAFSPPGHPEQVAGAVRVVVTPLRVADAWTVSLAAVAHTPVTCAWTWLPYRNPVHVARAGRSHAPTLVTT
jgi:hypothetical protein